MKPKLPERQYLKNYNRYTDETFEEAERRRERKRSRLDNNRSKMLRLQEITT